MSHAYRILGLVAGFFLGGCVVSTTPLLNANSRVLPFRSGAHFEVYERSSAREPWEKKDETEGFEADEALVVRKIGGTGKKFTYTFHPVQLGRFLMQINVGEKYAYAVMEIRNGEGIIFDLNCLGLDHEAFKRAGGTVKDDPLPSCYLDGIREPVERLKDFAMHPWGLRQYRYVPVRKK